MGHLRWNHEVLRDPSPDDLRRRRLVPLSRFRDNDIDCIDAASWERLEGFYRARLDEQDRLRRLQDDMERNGIFRHVVIGSSNGSLFVSDGHHRVHVARELGWTHLPYRWFRRENWCRWETGSLPEPATPTT